jgi:hypothetical protein
MSSLFRTCFGRFQHFKLSLHFNRVTASVTCSTHEVKSKTVFFMDKEKIYLQLNQFVKPVCIRVKIQKTRASCFPLLYFEFKRVCPLSMEAQILLSRSAPNFDEIFYICLYMVDSNNRGNEGNGYGK